MPALLLSAGLVISMTVAVSSPALAADDGPLACGAQITQSVTLTNNIGPCTASDGLDIVADGVTVDLNGHSITGSDTTNATTTDYVGINMTDVSEDTVTGPGVISQFDAGVSISGGSGDTVTKVTAESNISHVLFTGDGARNTNQLYKLPCNLGDGITADNTTNSTISHNIAKNNGPYSGISLVDASSGNTVTGNQTDVNSVSNVEQTPKVKQINGQPGPCGPFGASPTGQGREHQDQGIRIEGPGATYNTVSNNQSVGNQLEGIAVFDNICPDNTGGVPPTPPNDHNTIQGNYVSDNGYPDMTDGIAILTQGPEGIVCVPSYTTIDGNTSVDNAYDGIYVGGRGSHDQTITNNTLSGNGNDGIELAGPSGTLPGTTNDTITGNSAHGDGVYDAADGNPGCDSNLWSGNDFGTVNQACVG